MSTRKLHPEAQRHIDSCARMMNLRLDILNRTHGLTEETLARVLFVVDKLSTEDRERVLRYAEGLAEWDDGDQ